MPTSRLVMSGTVGGASIASTLSRTASGEISHAVTVPVSQAGTLSTRTGHTEGVLTLGADHGITTAQVIDIYWDSNVAGTIVKGRRYGCVVGTVAGVTVPITASGAGDNFPLKDAVIYAAPRTTLDVDFVGTLAVALAAQSPQRSCAVMWVSTVAQLILDLTAGEAWTWFDGGTAANPITGDTISHVTVSNASPTATAAFRLGILYDSEV